MPILIFGHKNPDTDSVTSAIALSHLKNQIGLDTIPCVLGSVNKESQYILDCFHLPSPLYIPDVKIQVKDLQYDFAKGVSPSQSILYTYNLMGEIGLDTVGVVDSKDKLLGIVSMQNIAMGLIHGDFYHLETSLENIVDDLNAKVLSGKRDYFDGRVAVVAYYYETIKGQLDQDNIVIVGDRYDIIEHAILSKVQLIIVTGGNELPEKYIDLANSNGVTIILVEKDTYYISKVLNMCNYVRQIMTKDNIVHFNELEYLDEVKDELSTSRYRNYPVIDRKGKFSGFLNRKHIINPTRKKVILVDHNEYMQSAEGLEEAEILEIVDHHKIGDISTSMPINFRNSPVGSTCTIIYYMYREYNIEIPFDIAGALISGILSDTLLFKSPTTTSLDRKAVKELNKIVNLDVNKFAMDMFKYGTSLEGQSIEDIFYKDFKEFQLESFKTGVSQVFTLDIDDVFNRKELFLDFIGNVHKRMNYDITLLLVTDILKEGSYILYESKHINLVPSAFNVKNEQGVFANNIVSRKKQVIPKLLHTIELIK